MKVLKWFLYILLALVVIVVILGLIGPKTFKVERNVVIAASPEAVWPHLSSLKKVAVWSPFAKMDTTMVVEYAGNDGEVGSVSKWTGKKAGKGEQTVTSIDPGKSSNVHLKFFTPMGVMESDAYMNLEPDPGGSKVTWGFYGENKFIGKVMGTFSNMEKMMGPVFESGLADLKTLVESSPSVIPSAGFKINPGEYAGGQYLGVKGDVKMTDLGAFFTTNFQVVMDAVKKSGGEMTGAPVGLFWTWDTDKGMTNMAAAIPVKGITKAPKGTELMSVDAAKSLTINYTGGYVGSEKAHLAMDDYIKTNNLEQKPPVIEEYITGPGAEPDSNKWATNIIYLIK